MSQRTKRLRQRRRGGRKTRRPYRIRTAGSGVAVAALLGLVGWAWWGNRPTADELPDPPSWLPKCPVGGGPVNFAHRESTPDGPVFLCCEHCVERFHAEPEAFEEAIADQREALNSLPGVQVACPVSSDPIDPEVYWDSPDGRVCFCSPECRDRFAEGSERFRSGLADSYWYQTSCPVDDTPISPRVAVTLPTGETIYLCSEQCRDKFTHDSATYAARLAHQGIRLHLN